jgi:hypothetical protein
VLRHDFDGMAQQQCPILFTYLGIAQSSVIGVVQIMLSYPIKSNVRT